MSGVGRRFYFQYMFVFLGMPFTTTVWATFGQIPWTFAIRFEAGSERTSLRTTLHDRVYAELEASKNAAERAIKGVQDDISWAQGEVNKFNCEEEALLNVEFLQARIAANDAKHRRRLAREPPLAKPGRRKLLSVGSDVEGVDSTSSAAVDSALAELFRSSPSLVNPFSKPAEPRVNSKALVQHGLFPRNRNDDEEEALLEDALTARQAENYGFVGNVVGGVGTVVGGVVDTVKENIVDPVVSIGCEVLKAAAVGVLELYKKSLDLVIWANKVGYAVMKGLAGLALIVDYAKLEAGLSTNVLSSYISATLRFTFGTGFGRSPPFKFDLYINLGDLGKTVKAVFEECINWLTSRFKAEEAIAMLQQKDYSPEAMTWLSEPGNRTVFPVTEDALNDDALKQEFNAAEAAASLPTYIGTKDPATGEFIVDPERSHAAYSELEEEEAVSTVLLIRIHAIIEFRESQYKELLTSSLEKARQYAAAKAAAAATAAAAVPPPVSAPETVSNMIAALEAAPPTEH